MYSCTGNTEVHICQTHWTLMMVKPQLAMHDVLCFPQILLISFTFVCFLDLVSFSVARHRNTSAYSIKSGQSVLNLKKINNNHQTQYVSLGSSATLWSEICLFNLQLAVGELFQRSRRKNSALIATGSVDWNLGRFPLLNWASARPTLPPGSWRSSAPPSGNHSGAAHL